MWRADDAAAVSGGVESHFRTFVTPGFVPGHDDV
jgi:hypothetical protein